MHIDDERIKYAVAQTEILRPPRQSLATFGVTTINYYLVTEAAYSELVGGPSETAIREGRVIAEQPRVVTPYYLSRLEGFSPNARRYLDTLIEKYGASTPGLYYTYRNEFRQVNIVSDSLPAVVARLRDEVDGRGERLTSIIKGGDDTLWDVSLMKFIYELTAGSLRDNLTQLENHGLLGTDSRGVPRDARRKIEELFGRVGCGECEPRELKAELDRWDIFAEYEDRFYRLFQRG